jgi:hypothetical protein
VTLGLGAALVLLLCWAAVHLVAPVAASGTWVIEDETVVIADTVFAHEGNVVVRGTGRLLVQNATLRLQQVASWQFAISIEDAGNVTLDSSRLESKYPFRISISGSGGFTAVETDAHRAQLELGDQATCFCDGTALLGVSLSHDSSAHLAECELTHLHAQDSANLTAVGCRAETLQYQGHSGVQVNGSTLSRVVSDGGTPGMFANSTLGSLRCWGVSNVVVYSCRLDDFRYADQAQTTISKSSIGYLDATGASPLRLEEIQLGNATLRGSANVTMTNCTAGDVEAYLYCTIQLYSSSCRSLTAIEYVRVTIQGTPTHRCNVTSCVVTQLATANISFAAFDYLEISHSAKAQVNDSYATSFNNWMYGTVVLNISRCSFYDLRTYGAILTMSNTSVSRWANIDGGTTEASYCTFGEWTAFYSGCRAFLRNCTVDPLAPHDAAQIELTSCDTSVVILDYNARLQTLDSVPTGHLSYWNSNKSNGIPAVPWNLTAIDTNISGWDLHFRWTKSYIVENCTLRRVYCYGSSQVMMTSVRIDYLEVGSNVSVVDGAIDRLWLYGSGHCLLSNCTVALGWILDYSLGEFSDCSFSQELNVNSRAEFHNCCVVFQRCTGASEVTFFDSEITFRLECWNSPTVACHNTLVTGGISAMDSSRVSLFNCTVSGFSGIGAAILFSQNCSIASLYVQEQSLYEGIQTMVGDFYCAGSGMILFTGNLTHTGALTLRDSATVSRDLEVLVLDQNGQPVADAVIEIYSPLGDLLFQDHSDSSGFFALRLTFTAANASRFAGTFRCTVFFGIANSTHFFAMTSPQPLAIVLDLSGAPKAPTGHARRVKGLSDSDGIALGGSNSRNETTAWKSNHAQDPEGASVAQDAFLALLVVMPSQLTVLDLLDAECVVQGRVRRCLCR